MRVLSALGYPVSVSLLDFGWQVGFVSVRGHGGGQGAGPPRRLDLGARNISVA